MCFTIYIFLGNGFACDYPSPWPNGPSINVLSVSYLFSNIVWKSLTQEPHDIIMLQPVAGMGGDHPRAAAHSLPDQNQNVNVKPANSVASVVTAAGQAVASKQHHEQQRLTHEQVCLT